MNINFKKLCINAVVFIFFVGITFYVVFKDNNINEIIQITSNVNKLYVFIALLCMSFFILSEGINILRTLKLLNCKVTLANGIKYALVGFFFSSVTPGSSGGDPMQIYYMKKDGLPLGQSTLAILAEFSSFQFVTIVMALVGFFTNYKFIENSIGNIKYLLFIGVFINVCILLLILLSAFSKKWIIMLVDFTCRILSKLHYKKVEEFKEKCLEQIKEYKAGTNLLMNNKKILFKIVLTTLIQITLFHSIPYFVYLSFGLSGANYFSFIALQAVLYISVSSLPLPGAVGVSEGGFILIYKLLFPTELLNSAMLLSRGISFYLVVLVTGLSILCFSLKRNQNWKTEPYLLIFYQSLENSFSILLVYFHYLQNNA